MTIAGGHQLNVRELRPAAYAECTCDWFVVIPLPADDTSEEEMREIVQEEYRRHIDFVNGVTRPKFVAPPRKKGRPSGSKNKK